MNDNLSILQIECGTVYSFGGNNNGQCGLGYLSEKEDAIKIITTFIQENVQITSVHCGQHHSSAIDMNGNLWCFGYNEHNQCSTSNAMANDGLYQ